jgi:sugar/nucleoside kinase (ribokinase family)
MADVFCPGKLTEVENAVIRPGGAVANTGLVLSRLGQQVVLAARIGNDMFGEAIRRCVGGAMAAGLRTVDSENTSYTIVLAPPGVDRFFLHYASTNDTFGPEDIDYELVSECGIFHFGYPPLMKRMHENGGAALVEIFRRAKELGVTASLDTSMPDASGDAGRADWNAILRKVAPYTDIFAPSIEELAFMLDRPLFEKRKAGAAEDDPVTAYESGDCEDLSERLIEMGVGIVLIKCGIRGLYLRTAPAESVRRIPAAAAAGADGWAGRQVWAPAFEAETFGSALGAGDATVAGFLCALARGFPPEKALRTANMVGCRSVQTVDASSGIGSLDEIIGLLEGKTAARPLELDSGSWSYSKDLKVYLGPHDRR